MKCCYCFCDFAKLRSGKIILAHSCSANLESVWNACGLLCGTNELQNTHPNAHNIPVILSLRGDLPCQDDPVAREGRHNFLACSRLNSLRIPLQIPILVTVTLLDSVRQHTMEAGNGSWTSSDPAC